MIQELAPRFGHKPENIDIENIGVKPGEKMYEELMNIEETRRTWELPRYFVVLPAYGGIYHEIQYQYLDIVSKDVSNPYNSQNEESLTKANLNKLLIKTGLLYEDTMTEHPSERYWP